MAVPQQPVPAEVVALARERARARGARDWRTADELRSRIETAGWKVVDTGTDFTLAPARPPDVVHGDRVLYGAPGSVPSRLDEAADRTASVLLQLPEDAASTSACLAALRDRSGPGLQVIVVADASSVEREEALRLLGEACGLRPTETGGPGVHAGAAASRTATTVAAALEAEVLWTSAPLGPGASLAAAALRARGATVIALDAGCVPGADLVAPLGQALADPRIAVAGMPGRHSSDLHHFEPAGPGHVTAIGGGCLAFRRQDVARRDARDERLHLAESVAIWWSLLLRDEGPGREPRGAVALELQLARREPPPEPTGATRDRLARRDAYRLAERFRQRPELADARRSRSVSP